MVVERKRAVAHLRANELVHRIVSADILTHAANQSFAVKQAGRVEPTGLGEYCLQCAELIAQGCELLRRNTKCVFKVGLWLLGLECLKGGFSTHAAA